VLTLIKHLHIGFACLTIIGLIVRVYWLLYYPQKLTHRLVKILPHINDTGLFLSGLTMAIGFGYPIFAVYWLPLKLILILFYIGIGFIIFKTPMASIYRFILLVASLITYASILWLAINKPSI